MNATTQISEVTFPPYTLTGAVAYRDLTTDDVWQEGDLSTSPDGYVEHMRKDAIGHGTQVTEGQLSFQPRRRLDPTPDNYRAMQAAWLSHFNVGVGSRVRVVANCGDKSLGWGWTDAWVSPEMDGCVGAEGVVTYVYERMGIAVKCDRTTFTYAFPFHVLAPVEEQPKVEVIELTEENNFDINGVTHIVQVRYEVGEKEPEFYRDPAHGRRWMVNPAKGLETDDHGDRFLYARRAEPHEHPPAVPEGQGEETTEQVMSELRAMGVDADGAVARLHQVVEDSYQRAKEKLESPTPAIERGEEVLRPEIPVIEVCSRWIRVDRKWELGLFEDGSWFIPGREASVSTEAITEYGDIIQPTPTPSAGQEGCPKRVVFERLPAGSVLAEEHFLTMGDDHEFYSVSRGDVGQIVEENDDFYWRKVPYDEEGGQSGWVIAGKGKEIERLRGEVERLTTDHEHRMDRIDRLEDQVSDYMVEVAGLNEKITTLTADLGRAREAVLNASEFLGGFAAGARGDGNKVTAEMFEEVIAELTASLRPAAKDGGAE